jgi:hypothetical protein
MEMSGQLHAPAALPPGKEPPGTHLIGGAVLRAGLVAVANNRKKNYPCWESNPDRPARSSVTVLNEIPRLYIAHKSLFFSETPV